jgi:hypothetical protein
LPGTQDAITVSWNLPLHAADAYQGGSAEIQLRAQAVQATNNPRFSGTTPVGGGSGGPPVPGGAQFSISGQANFGTVLVGATPREKTYTVTNIGGSTGIPRIQLTAADSSSWQIASNGCTAPVSAGRQCAVTVQFAPTRADLSSSGKPVYTPITDTASLVAAPSASGLALQGTTNWGCTASQTNGCTCPNGTSSANGKCGAPAPGAAELSLAGTTNFGTVLVGNAAKQETYTVTNTGGSAGAPQIQLSATDSSEWQIVSNACTGKVSAGGQCTVTVAFAPTRAGLSSNGTPTYTTITGTATLVAAPSASGTGLTLQGTTNRGCTTFQTLRAAGCNLQGRTLFLYRGANLSGAGILVGTLNNANLEYANLEGVTLLSVQMNYANLKNANLSHAVMEVVQMNYAKLQGAMLTGALLVDVQLLGANMTGANPIGVLWLLDTCPKRSPVRVPRLTAWRPGEGSGSARGGASRDVVHTGTDAPARNGT